MIAVRCPIWTYLPVTPPETLIPLGTITDGDVESFLVLVVFFLIGLLLIYGGFNSLKRAKIIKNTSPERVRSLAVGRSEVHGQTRIAADVLCEPFGTDLCLYRRWKVEEYRKSGKNNNRSWRTIASGREAVPFYVEDETGAVLVDPDTTTDFEISSANTDRTRLSRGASLPAEIASFYDDDTPDVEVVTEHRSYIVEDVSPTDIVERSVDSTDAHEGEAAKTGDPSAAAADGGERETQEGEEKSEEPDSEPPVHDSKAAGGILSGLRGSLNRSSGGLLSGGRKRKPRSRYRRRFTQEVLPVDEEVYVFGGATEREGAGGSNADRLKIETDDSSGLFIVSDRDEDGITKYYKRQGPVLIGLGLLMSAGTLYLLLHDFAGL